MRKMQKLIRKIFLSYSFRDKEEIDYVKKALMEKEFEVVSDVDIDVTETISGQLSKRINGCDVFILIISGNTNEQVQNEYFIALAKQKKIFIYIREDCYKEEIKVKFGARMVGLWKDESELAEKIVGDISRYSYMYPQRGYQFEKLIEEMFKSYGFFTTWSKKDGPYDFCAEKGNVKFYIEAKATRQRVLGYESIVRVIAAAQIWGDGDTEKFVLVTANSISIKLQEQITKCKNLIVVDIANLLYMVQENETMKSQLLSLLEFSVDEIEPKKPEELLRFLGNTGEKIDEKVIIRDLIDEIQNWNPDVKKSAEYEDLCIRALNTLFASDLGLWNAQQCSNEDLYRFDLICKIKDGISEAFWIFIEEYFHSKYIVFEFKNYRKQITQKEIYTTEKYLYAKALRCVAIIISCNGEDKNSKKAINGTLRENGKLILSISNADMLTMLEGKLAGNSPAEYLYNMLDTLLIELDK